MLHAVFPEGIDEIEVSGLTQWDRGQVLKITCPGLPTLFQVHMTYRGAKSALTAHVLDSTTVAIPDELLRQRRDLVAYLYFIDADGSGETVKTVHLPVIHREKPEDYTADLTPTQLQRFEMLLMEINEKSDNAQEEAAVQARAAAASASAAKSSETAAASSASAAGTSASNASASATAAKSSETAATGSASTASTSASNASASASAAKASETAAAGLASDAAASASAAKSSETAAKAAQAAAEAAKAAAESATPDLSAHNADSSAHSDIREQISQLSNEIADLSVYATPQMYGGTNSTAIQQAINENDYVLLPEGNYTIGSTVTIPSNKKIQIEGTVNINCPIGFQVNGECIEICGNGVINISTSDCSAIQVLVNKSIGFVKIRDVAVWGAWNYNNSNNHIGVEFVGDSLVGTCCYVDINCYLNCLTKAIYTHESDGQNVSSWLTQIDVHSTIQNCQQAIVFDWGGGNSRIRGVIQPKCTSAVTPNSVDLPLCILPDYSYIDSAIWDMDTAINKHAIKVNGNYCTIFSAISESYIDVNVAYIPTLMLRIPTGNLVTKEYFEENKPSLNVSFHIDDDGNLIMEENAPYMNLVPSGKDTDGTILNGVGYVDNYRISASNNVTAQTGTVLTGYIPYENATDADNIKTKGVQFVEELYCGIMFYDANFNIMAGLRLIAGKNTDLLNNTVEIIYTAGSGISVDDDGVATIHLNFIEDNLVNNPVSYFRLFAKGKGSGLIVTRNEKIVDYNPNEKNVGKVVPDSDYSTEDWEFTLEDGSTVTKKVVLA